MIEKGILSRPTYQALCIKPAQRHLMVADGKGARAILRILKDCSLDVIERTTIFYIKDGQDASYTAQLESLNAHSLITSYTFASILPRLKAYLIEARSGLRVYLAGTEGRIFLALQTILAAGVDHLSIQKEHQGSLNRRVQCVHCKGITDHVQTQPCTCSHCGLLLFVRDHYSRRIGAFQGVCINAEDPSEIIEGERVFL